MDHKFRTTTEARTINVDILIQTIKCSLMHELIIIMCVGLLVYIYLFVYLFIVYAR